MATEWLSDTSAACRVAAGSDGSLVLAVTVGDRGGSETEAASYDGIGVSSAARVNGGSTGGGSMTVSGAGLGTRR